MCVCVRVSFIAKKAGWPWQVREEVQLVISQKVCVSSQLVVLVPHKEHWGNCVDVNRPVQVIAALLWYCTQAH